ncbi:hypothetical protein GCM10010913_24190 [Paenibacillus aceti]|uniref:Uncharacterized protein n=1 Tax=Paenibacillus aceti TaxID=1820010 RepID=A0ABQ1VWW9_9BACL|nr:hypothetical protein GCM10010913_24190 [Paenibacillus aceti]
MRTERQKLAQDTPFETSLHLFHGEMPGPVVMTSGSIYSVQQLVKHFMREAGLIKS